MGRVLRKLMQPNLKKKSVSRDFPGGPVVNDPVLPLYRAQIPCFVRGQSPGSHTVWPKNKKNTKHDLFPGLKIK